MRWFLTNWTSDYIWPVKHNESFYLNSTDDKDFLTSTHRRDDKTLSRRDGASLMCVHVRRSVSRCYASNAPPLTSWKKILNNSERTRRFDTRTIKYPDFYNSLSSNRRFVVLEVPTPGTQNVCSTSRIFTSSGRTERKMRIKILIGSKRRQKDVMTSTLKTQRVLNLWSKPKDASLFPLRMILVENNLIN